MSRGGHNRRPEHLKLLRGTARPDRSGGDEPRPQPIAPKPPRGLHPEARRTWKRLAPLLEGLGLLTALDGLLFSVFCEAAARRLRAAARLEETLELIAERRRGGQSGTPYTAEEMSLIRRAEISVEKGEASVRLLASEFGLSPASRSRLDVPAVGERDELDEFLDRPRGGMTTGPSPPA